MSFETEVRKLLDNHFPCCALSNIPVFRPDVPEERVRGYEIDHLLHIRTDVSDRIIIVECKDKPVFGASPDLPPTDEGPWNVPFRDAPPRDIKRAQLRNHAHALLSYLHDHPRPVLIEAWLVSSDDTTATRADKRGRRIHYRLLGRAAFARELVRTRNEQNVLRVEQSALLAELRKGVPVRDMGHPELNNAIAYVSRCRNSIDMELFNLFEPRPQRWAINGTAGMGKTVLLAYALFVFASDRRVSIGQDSRESTRTLVDFAKEGERLGLPAHRDRVIHAVARKEKQLHSHPIAGKKMAWKSRFALPLDRDE